MAEVKGYTSVNGAVLVNSVPMATVDFMLKVDRGAAESNRTGKYGKLKLPGEIDADIEITQILKNTTMMAKALGKTVLTGAAATLHAGLTAPGAGNESITDMTVTDAGSSLIKLTALTAAVTAGGVAYLIGTDINDQAQTDRVVIPTLGINETVTSNLVFKTLAQVVLVGGVQEGGTIKVESVVGVEAIVISEPDTFDLVGMVEKDGKYFRMVALDCWINSADFAWSDPNTVIQQKLGVTITDIDEGLTLVGVST